MTHLRGCLSSSLIFCPAGQCLPREGTEESGISSPSTDTPLEGLHPPYTEPLMSPGRLSTQAGPGGRRPPYPVPFPPRPAVNIPVSPRTSLA